MHRHPVSGTMLNILPGLFYVSLGLTCEVVEIFFVESGDDITAFELR